MARKLPLAVVALALLAAPALAQSSLGIGTAEPSIDTGGLFGGFFATVNAYQQSFYRALTGALSAMRDDPWQLWGLVGLSFAYGVFHAAGPGHGKAVISSYMIANEVALRRGVTLSFVSALMQGAVAMLVVGAAYFVLRGTSISMTVATSALERASFALIALFGAWLVWKKLAPVMRSTAAPSMQFAHAHAVVGGHSPEAGHLPLQRHDTGAHDHTHHHAHDHHHDHQHDHGHDEVCASCGHVHAPDPALLKKERLNPRDAWAAVAAVGLRPCSGALIVLTFALLNGLYLGGILSVLAMSIGTAITVSILASMAVGAKGLALRYAAGGGHVARITNAIEIAGALLVLVLGIVLFTASFAA